MSLIKRSDFFPTIQKGKLLPPKGIVFDAEVSDPLTVKVYGVTKTGTKVTLLDSSNEDYQLDTGITRFGFERYGGDIAGLYFEIHNNTDEGLLALHNVTLINNSPVDVPTMDHEPGEGPWDVDDPADFKTEAVNTVKKGKRTVPKALAVYYETDIEDENNHGRMRVKGISNGSVVTLFSNHDLVVTDVDTVVRLVNVVEIPAKVPCEAIWVEFNDIEYVSRIINTILVAEDQDNLASLE